MKSTLIMAGGEGTRLRPLTLTTPKPLIKIKGKFLIDYTIDCLNKSNIKNKEILVCLKYKPESLKTYLLSKKIDYFISEAGLAQNIYSASKYMSDHFLAVSSDIIQSTKIVTESLEVYRQTGASALFHSHSNKKEVIEFYVDETLRPKSTLSIFNSKDLDCVKSEIKSDDRFTDLAVLLSDYGFKVYYFMSDYPCYEVDTIKDLYLVRRRLNLNKIYM